MRSSYREALVIVFLAAPGMTFAQNTPEEHAAHHPPQQATTSEVVKKTDAGEKSVKDAQADQAKMQVLMDKIHQTKDPAERKRLLEQHEKMMHEEILAMRHMKCPMTSGDMMKCHQLTETRMDMTNELLQQMLEHEEAER